MNFLRQWKFWIRPVAVAIYFILAIVALVLCTIELERKGAPIHVEAWYAGGFFVLLAIPISLWGILQHLINYTQPHLQRHIIRYVNLLKLIKCVIMRSESFLPARPINAEICQNITSRIVCCIARFMNVLLL